MKLTQADIRYAELVAFERAWPTLRRKYMDERRNQAYKRTMYGLQIPDKTKELHAAINERGKLGGFSTRGQGRKGKYKYNTAWHNFFVFIGPKGIHKTDWRNYRVWQHSTSTDYLTCMGRISRRLRKSEGR